MKRIFSIFICISMLVMCISGLNLIAFAALEGEGTEANPYIITTPDEFINNLKGDRTGTYFVIQNDIVLDSTYVPRAFKGNLKGAVKPDGSKYKITVNITSTSQNIGTFDTFGGGTIENLEFAGNISFSGTVPLRIGGVAGRIDSAATIKDCITSITITGTEAAASAAVGGVVGYACDATIINCENKGTINADVLYCGGIIGATLNIGNTVSNCKNSGNITDNTAVANSGVGGIAGRLYYATDKVTGCVNTGNVASKAVYSGGIVGYIYNGNIENSVNQGTIRYASSAKPTIRSYVGGISGGISTGEIAGCSNSGTVISDATNEGEIYAGGIAGYNNATITKCSNTSDFSNIRQAGGIVGNNYTNGKITLSYNSGNFQNSVGYKGGIAASSTGTISNCFNIGNTPGTHSGGIAGSLNGAVSNSYIVISVNQINSVRQVGTGALTNVYYAINTAGKLTGTPTGEQVTFEELLDNTSVFSEANGWRVLDIDETNKYPLPQLIENPYYEAYTIPEIKKENTTDYAGGFGTEEKPYLIENETHFANIVKYDAQGVYFKLNKDGIEISTPVAILNGIFDGDNKTIKLAIDTTLSETLNTGLFAQLEKTATVKNLVLEGSVSGSEAKNANVGALAGSSIATASLHGNIINVTNNATVSGNIAGGIIGCNYSFVEKCANNGNVSSIGPAGGIAGYSYWKIEKSYNTGRISSTSGSATSAGIAAHLRTADAYIDTCYNIGTVTGVNAVGIAGSFSHDDSIIKVSNTFNAGAVIRRDTEEPAIQRNNTNQKDSNLPQLSNVYNLTCTAYDDKYDITNITTLQELADLNIEGFTKGRTYPVITENPESEVKDIIKLSVSASENGTTTLYDFGSLKERFMKSGEQIVLIIKPNSGYMGNISRGGIEIKSGIINEEAYISNNLTSDTEYQITYVARPATDADDIKITTKPNVYIPEVISEGEEYTIKNQDGEYTVKAGVKYTAVFSKVNQYYGWTIDEYGIEINGTKYPSKLPLTDNFSYGIVVEDVPDDSVIKSYVTYHETSNQDNTLTVYSNVAEQE